MFHSDYFLLLAPDLLLAAAAAAAAGGDFPGSSSSARNHKFRGARDRSTLRWPPRRQTAAHALSLASLLRQLAVHASVHVWARGSFSGDGTPHPGSSGAVLLLHPFGGPPQALLIHLFADFASAALRQSPSPRFDSFFSSSPVPQP